MIQTRLSKPSNLPVNSSRPPYLVLGVEGISHVRLEGLPTYLMCYVRLLPLTREQARAAKSTKDIYARQFALGRPKDSAEWHPEKELGFVAPQSEVKRLQASFGHILESDLSRELWTLLTEDRVRAIRNANLRLEKKRQEKR